MFTQLLGQHFVHTALLAGAVVAITSGAIGTFVVTRGASFAVHAISELGFTGAAGALVVVRIGLRAIAGSEGPGPAALPQSGTVAYQGRTWSVFSLEPTPPARIFVLVQQSG